MGKDFIEGLLHSKKFQKALNLAFDAYKLHFFVNFRALENWEWLFVRSPTSVIKYFWIFSFAMQVVLPNMWLEIHDNRFSLVFRFRSYHSIIQQWYVVVLLFSQYFLFHGTSSCDYSSIGCSRIINCSITYGIDICWEEGNLWCQIFMCF